MYFLGFVAILEKVETGVEGVLVNINGYLVPEHVHQRLHILTVANHEITIGTAIEEQSIDDRYDLLEHAVLPLVHHVVLVLEAEVTHVGNGLEVLECADMSLNAIFDGVNDDGAALVPVVITLREDGLEGLEEVLNSGSSKIL